PVRRRPARRRLPEAAARGDARRGDARGPRPPRGGDRRGRGARAPRRVGATAGGAVNPRDDIALMDGYHSPQLDVKVRLNTNESPYPPRPAWLDASLVDLRTPNFNGSPAPAAPGPRAAMAPMP